MVFIDLEKTYDKVFKRFIMVSFRKERIFTSYIVIKDMYDSYDVVTSIITTACLLLYLLI